MSGEKGPSGPRRTVLKAAGLVSVGLGLLGAFLPLVPTTPFVLLASACFARSSPRLNEWLHEHDVLGPPLNAWEEHRALPRRAKIVAIATLWVTIPFSIYLIANVYARGVLVLVLLVFTVLLGRIPTLESHEEQASAGRA